MARIHYTCRLGAALLLFAIARPSPAQTPDTSLIDELNRQSFALYKEDPDSATALAREAIARSEKIGYLTGLGDGFVRLGLVEKDRGNYSGALAHYRQSLGYRRQLGDEDLVARVYNNMGMVFTWSARYDSAIHYLLQALHIAERLQLEKYRPMYLMNLGIAYENNNDYADAIRCHEEAQALYRDQENVSGLLRSTVNLGGAYYSSGEFLSSIFYSREAMELAARLEDDLNLHRAMGNLAVAYLDMGRYDSARYFMQRSLAYNLGNEDPRGAAIDQRNLGLVFERMGLPDSSARYYRASLATSQAIGERKLAAENAESLAGLSRAGGDFRTAFDYQQLASRYRDSVFSESKAEAIASMQTRYETEKKEKEIDLLNKENKIKELTIRRQALLRNGIIGLAALLAVIGVLLFNRYRTAQRQRQQDERMRISSDLHDEIGSTLSSIGMYSAYAAERIARGESGEAKTVLDEISTTSRQTIDDMNDIIWSINPRNDSFGHVVNRLRNYATRMAQSGGLQLDFRADETLDDLSLSMEERKNLYMVCKEAVNNAVKYSGCSNLTMNLSRNGGNLHAGISDDGKGFLTTAGYEGNGLKNMKHRAEQIGAQLNIASEPGKGSAVTLSLPLS